MSETIDDKSYPITTTKPSLSEQEKRNYYETWKCSGMNKRKFCQEHGLSLGEFYYWHKRFKPKTTIEPEQFSLVSATVSLACEPQDIIQIEIRLPNQGLNYRNGANTNWELKSSLLATIDYIKLIRKVAI